MTAFLYPDPSLLLDEKVYRLGQGITTIGRNPNNTIVLMIASISRFHATIEERNNHYLIKDNVSSNGTFLNNMKVNSLQLLNEGDVITFGHAQFTFSYHDQKDFKQVASDSFKSVGVALIGDDKGGQDDSMFIATQASVPSVISPDEDPESLDPQQTRRALRRLTIFYKFAEIVSECKTRNELLNKTIDLLFEAIYADRVAILLTDPHDRKSPKPVLMRYRDESMIQGEDNPHSQTDSPERTKAVINSNPIDNRILTISRTMVSKCIEQRATILSCDTRIDERFKNSDSLMFSGACAAICVPLLYRDQVLGVLFVDTLSPDKLFQQEDANFLSSFGLDLAVMLENFTLHVQNIHQERLAAIGTTFAGMAHNIKNILQLAKGGLDLVEKAIEKDDIVQAKDYWPILKKGVDRMTSLTQEILAFSRQEKIELVPTDINATLNEILQGYAQTAHDKLIDVQSDFATNIPQFKLNAECLAKAIMNLLLNATDALNGLPGIIIVASHITSQGDLQIIVTDNGPGIPSNKLERIWEPFFTTKGSKGTGLGLTMTHKYIQDMGGEIDVSSVINQGTTFTISFPATLQIENQ